MRALLVYDAAEAEASKWQKIINKEKKFSSLTALRLEDTEQINTILQTGGITCLFCLFSREESWQYLEEKKELCLNSSISIYSSLLIGKANKKNEQAALEKGFSDFLPIDMPQRLPFVLSSLLRYSTFQKPLWTDQLRDNYSNLINNLGFWTLETDSLNLIISDTLKRILEIPRDQDLANLKEAVGFIFPEDLAGLKMTLQSFKYKKLGLNIPIITRIVTRSGKMKKIHCRVISYSRDENGALKYLSGFCFDTNVLSQTEEIYYPKEDIVGDLLNSIPLGVYLLDKDLKFIFASGKVFLNEGAINLELSNGLTAENFDSAFHQMAQQMDNDESRELITKRITKEKTSYLYQRIRKLPDGKFNGFILDISHEVNTTKELESKNRESIRLNKLLNFTQKLTKTASIFFYLDSDEVIWTKEMYNLLDIDEPDHTPTLEYFYRFIHSDDKAIFNSQIEGIIQSLNHVEQNVHTPFRIVTPKKEIKYVEARSQSFEVIGSRTRVLAFTDITEKHQRVEQLKQRDAFFSLIYEDSVEAIAVFDKNWRFLNLNEKAKEILELDDSVIQSTFSPHLMIDAQEREKQPLNLEQLLDGKAITNYRKIKTQNGHVKYIHHTTKLMPNDTYLVIFRDVTSQFKVRKHLEKLHTLQNFNEKMVKMGSKLIDLKTSQQIWSDQVYEILGLSPQQHQPGLDLFFEQIHPKDRASIRSQFESLLNGQPPPQATLKYRVITPSGQEKVLISNIMVDYEKEEPSTIYAAVQDVTQREKELNQIKEYNLVLEQAYKMTRVGVIKWQPESQSLDWTKGIYDVFEENEEKFLPTIENILQFVPAPNRQLLMNELNQLLSIDHEVENTYKLKLIIKSKVKYVKIWGKVAFEKGGRVLLGIVQDITENYINEKRVNKLNKQLGKVLAEKEIALDQAMFRLNKIFENDLIGIGVVDASNSFVEVNSAFCQLLKYEKSEVIGQNGLFIMHPAEVPGCITDIQKFSRNEKDYSVTTKRLVKKNGEVIYAKMYITIVRTPRKADNITIMMIEDRSHQYNLEQQRQATLNKLKESEATYRFLSESSTDFIAIHDKEGIYKFVNQAVEPLLGYKKEELVGRSPYDFFHPEDIPQIRQDSHDPLLKKEIESSTMVYRFRKKDGSYTWLDTRAKCVVDGNGNIVGIHTYNRDISKLKEAEEQMRITLEKERELNSLRSQFVTTASHQFRTPLAGIKASAQYLSLIAQDPEVREITKNINSESNRLTILMNDILTLGKLDANRLEAKPQHFFPERIVEKIIQQYLRTQTESRVIECKVKNSPYLIYKDPDLLEHALSNLISNALKYSRGRPTPIVTINYLKKKLVIEVQDFGIGISKSDQKNLFKSFFRGNNVQDIEGTGLGLVIARQFVELNDGTLSLESQLNKGTTFKIEFANEP